MLPNNNNLNIPFQKPTVNPTKRRPKNSKGSNQSFTQSTQGNNYWSSFSSQGRQPNNFPIINPN